MAELNETLKMYQELTEVVGAPGFEGEARQVMKKYLEPFVDSIEYDNLGSLIGKKVGDENGPKIMVAGHLDEVGFMVTRITDDGYLRFQSLGGWWEQVMLAQRVTIHTRKGFITGVVGSKPPHVLPAEIRKKSVEKNDMFIDIGVASKDEAEEAGVRPGDPIVPICPFTVMQNPKFLMAKAWDNRFGCIVAIEVLRRLKEESHPNIVYSVGTVQEEVGLRGAMTSVNFVKPDIAFALDVGLAGDTPGMRPEEAACKLGKGPAIGLFDASMIAHKGLRELVVDTAEKENIPFQYEFIPGGGTDAGRFHIHGNGIPSIFIGAASRYIHSAASIIHQDDIDYTSSLIAAVIKRLDRTTVETLTTYR